MKKIIEILQKYGIVIFFIVFCIYLSFTAVDAKGNLIFFTPENLLNVARQISINTIIAVGMTFVILTGGIDLSVGSVLAFCGVISADIVFSKYPLSISLIAGIFLGSILGFFNGFIITKLKIPPFITTLAMMTIARGLVKLYTKALPISPLPENFKFIGSGYLGPIPFPVIIMIIILIVAYLILTKTQIGRYIYAVGGNEEAARLSGINVDRVKIFVYVVSGFLSALSGIILAARLGSGDPKSGVMYELNAIAAVVLGGTSLMGGIGSVTGTILGALIIGVLDNGLILLHIDPFIQDVIKGIVILVAVFLDQLKKRGR
jgi:ribose transport system permease protein